MANFIKKTTDPGSTGAACSGELYSVFCTECGRKLEKRFFLLDNLLRLYHNGRSDQKEAANFINLMGIGAYYGEPVLPAAAPLIRDGALALPNDPPEITDGARPACFECPKSSIPMDKMISLPLNIASIVAQFVRMSGFREIYRMLQIQREKDKVQMDGYPVPDGLTREFKDLCNRLIVLPGIQTGKMSQEDDRIQMIERALKWVLRSAEEEDKLRRTDPGRSHFSTEQILVGWRYECMNGRPVPAALLICGSSGGYYHNSSCCCSACRKQIPVGLGAYEQRIVGLLGTQSTGKTTYLSALADAIDLGEMTKRYPQDTESTRMTIQACMDGDQNWRRAMAEPAAAQDGNPGNSAQTDPIRQDASSKIGMLWLYQHGFPPEKTEAKAGDASALTFLVRNNREGKEPVMYTLADISGEAFQDTVSKKYDEEFLNEQHRLLQSCYALFMVISARQMYQDGKQDGDMGLITSPQKVLNCCQKFLPHHPLPAAVVMTSADEINGGSLRSPLHLAYDVRSVSALATSRKSSELVYNAELMRTNVQGVNAYINRCFGNFVNILGDSILQQQGKDTEVKIASFAVSSGTQEAPYYYRDEVTRPDVFHCPDLAVGGTPQSRYDAYHDPTEERARCSAMRSARFGVCAPLQWLLACDDMLELDYRDELLNSFAPGVQQGIARRLKESLFR